MILTDEIETYIKEWEETSDGDCRNGAWHLEWRKPHSNRCFRYIGKGNPSVISLSDEYKSTAWYLTEHLVVWDFGSKKRSGDIYRISIADKVLYLSPFTGKMQ